MAWRGMAWHARRGGEGEPPSACARTNSLGHKAAVVDVVVNDNLHHVLSASADHVLKVWDMRTPPPPLPACCPPPAGVVVRDDRPAGAPRPVLPFRGAHAAAAACPPRPAPATCPRHEA